MTFFFHGSVWSIWKLICVLFKSVLLLKLVLLLKFKNNHNIHQVNKMKWLKYALIGYFVVTYSIIPNENARSPVNYQAFGYYWGRAWWWCGVGWGCLIWVSEPLRRVSGGSFLWLSIQKLLIVNTGCILRITNSRLVIGYSVLNRLIVHQTHPCIFFILKFLARL